jgi:membrane protein YdbS with pleckstrin-like domain
MTLKLTGYLAWSWWWVLSPMWISLSIVLVILLGVFAFYVFKK